MYAMYDHIEKKVIFGYIKTSPSITIYFKNKYQSSSKVQAMESPDGSDLLLVLFGSKVVVFDFY